MKVDIITKSFDEPIYNLKEILRYTGCTSTDVGISNLLNECLKEINNKLFYKACFCTLPVKITENICDFEVFNVQSDSLAKNLCGCDRVILLAATIGSNLDRAILRYSGISPSKALVLQAIGAERIEALCNQFEEWYINEHSVQLKPRFSPGYGDLSLSVQQNIFNILNCDKKIGLTLNDSLLMSPSKSVTAFIGIKRIL